MHGYQGCSGAGTRQSAVPANIFEPERRSGKYCLSQAERSGISAQAAALSNMTYLNVSL